MLTLNRNVNLAKIISLRRKNIENQIQFKITRNFYNVHLYLLSRGVLYEDFCGSLLLRKHHIDCILQPFFRLGDKYSQLVLTPTSNQKLIFLYFFTSGSDDNLFQTRLNPLQAHSTQSQTKLFENYLLYTVSNPSSVSDPSPGLKMSFKCRKS